MSEHRLNAGERRAAFSLAGVYMLRMLGLFMVLPVLAFAAKQLDGYTPTLAGIAIGIYGLSQGVLQIPLGLLSDRVGRKPVIVAGLLVLILGSVIAATSDSIYGVIVGRFLQGLGAIASATMAMAADLSRESNRLKVMALIGMSIGMAFALAMLLGPLIEGWAGLAGIFWITALMGALGVFIILFITPTPAASRFHRDTEVEIHWFRHVLRNGQLLRVDYGVLNLHLIMTATFMAVPRVLSEHFGMVLGDHWQIYLPVLALSVAVVLPLIIVGERMRLLRPAVLGAVGSLALAAWGMGHWELLGFAGWLVVFWLFFVSFNLLEATLPSLVAKLSPAAHKGTAMGAFSSSQFVGVFLGGLLGGWISQHFGLAAVFGVNAALALVWLGVAFTMAPFPYFSSRLLHIGAVDAREAERLSSELSAIRGVAEAVVVREDGVAYLKVDNRELDQDALNAYAVKA